MEQATNGAAAMRVLIADDHGIVRSGLRVLLEQQDDIEVIAEASDGAEARDVAIRERPDLAILDVKMPKLTGLQATREIRAQAPDVAVLILSMYDDERYLFEALKAGASGYVLKAQADSDLLDAVRAVERGEPFLTPEAQRALIQDVLGEGSSREEELTPREQEVVKLVAEAHTNREIAEILHLSEKTVENHRSNAMRKLGMRDRVELVRYGIREGVIDPQPACSGEAVCGRTKAANPERRAGWLRCHCRAIIRGSRGITVFRRGGVGVMRRTIATVLVGIGLCLAVTAEPATAAPRGLFGITSGAQALDQQDFSKLRS